MYFGKEYVFCTQGLEGLQRYVVIIWDNGGKACVTQQGQRPAPQRTDSRWVLVGADRG